MARPSSDFRRNVELASVCRCCYMAYCESCHAWLNVFFLPQSPLFIFSVTRKTCESLTCPTMLCTSSYEQTWSVVDTETHV